MTEFEDTFGADEQWAARAMHENAVGDRGSAFESASRDGAGFGKEITVEGSESKNAHRPSLQREANRTVRWQSPQAPS